MRSSCRNRKFSEKSHDILIWNMKLFSSMTKKYIYTYLYTWIYVFIKYIFSKRKYDYNLYKFIILYGIKCLWELTVGIANLVKNRLIFCSNVDTHILTMVTICQRRHCCERIWIWLLRMAWIWRKPYFTFNLLF